MGVVGELAEDGEDVAGQMTFGNMNKETEVGRRRVFRAGENCLTEGTVHISECVGWVN